MLRRIFKILTAAALGRAWAQKSTKWLSIALGIMLFRYLDSRSSKRAKRMKAKKA